MNTLQTVEARVTLNSFEGFSHYHFVVVVPYDANYTRESFAAAVVAKEAEQQIIQGILAEREKTRILGETIMALREQLDLE